MYKFSNKENICYELICLIVFAIFNRLYRISIHHFKLFIENVESKQTVVYTLKIHKNEQK